MDGSYHGIWELTGLFFLTYLSEDAAVLAGGLAVASGSLSTWEGFLACFAGIWSGDFILYAIARFGGRPAALRFLKSGSRWEDRILRSEQWFRKSGIVAIAISRFVPGLRLPTFLAAGFLGMNTALFLLLTGSMGAVWVLAVFLIVHLLGHAAPDLIQSLRGHLLWILGGVLSLIVMGRLAALLIRNIKKIHAMERLTRWEFWPAWIFYLPIALRYLALSVRHGSLTLPSAANPGIKTGGLVGESKFATLNDLMQTSPEFVPPTALIQDSEDGTVEMRLLAFDQFIKTTGAEYPVILKPDLGFRGSGFKVIRSHEEARRYLETVPLPVIVQRYVSGPFEAGIFYYRFPSEEKGRILAITEKHFPKITGDGQQSIETLILKDARARNQATTLLSRFHDRRHDVLPAGESLRLVEAGNHAQGCLFSDGMHLCSTELEGAIDRISQKVPGFYIGRYDVRYESNEELRQGRGFKILELNGVAGEPTSAYDASKKITEAFAILFRHWDIAFAIGAENRRLGHRPDSIRTITSEWLSYRRLSRCHPIAD
jgi:membrane protein DedA with SNARE-associated domain